MMAAKEGVPVKTAHVTSSTPGGAADQPHLTGSSGTRISSNLTPLFDREDNLKEPDNEASSSEESDYNQASIIFSLDELQTSLPGLRASVSPEVPTADHSAGLLFPSLIQVEDDKISVSSKEEKEESDQNNEFDLSPTPPPVISDDLLKCSDDETSVHIDNKIAKCSTENSASVTAQLDSVATPDDSLLCHVDPAVHSTVVDTEPVTEQPNSSLICTNTEHSNLTDISLDDYVTDDKLTPIDTPPQVETPHIETPSNAATITQSSPVGTPIGRGLSEPLGEETHVELSHPDDISMHHDNPNDSISLTGSITSSSGSKTLSAKLKPAQNTFESPGLLYAHPVKKSSKKVIETLEPPETATEALLAEEKSPIASSPKESRHIRAKADNRGEIFIDQTHLPSFNYRNLTGIPLFYPPNRGSSTADAAADELLLDDSALKDIEKNAKKIAENLDYMLDNLRYSLHAMATCTKLSVSLHKEAIDDMHVTVDDSIKMMYAFLAKFEELNSNMKPIEALAAQIKDVSESLKILEKSIR